MQCSVDYMYYSCVSQCRQTCTRSDVYQKCSVNCCTMFKSTPQAGRQHTGQTFPVISQCVPVVTHSHRLFFIQNICFLYYHTIIRWLLNKSNTIGINSAIINVLDLLRTQLMNLKLMKLLKIILSLRIVTLLYKTHTSLTVLHTHTHTNLISNAYRAVWVLSFQNTFSWIFSRDELHQSNTMKFWRNIQLVLQNILIDVHEDCAGNHFFLKFQFVLLQL